MTIEGARLFFRNKIYFPLTSNIRQKRINNHCFTIISNNCWGGTIYESYNIQKMSPTVGLFFAPEDYLKFLSDIQYYISCELTFISPDESQYKERFSYDERWGQYPIGKINDIEIFFLHYHSQQEAYEKWMRRCKRIDWEHLLIKFNDQNGCTGELIREFDRLPFKNKICFTVSDEFSTLKSVCKIKVPKGNNCVLASWEPFGKNKIIDIDTLINSL